MYFGALGDIHGDFAHARRWIEQHPEVPFWVCVGDIASDEGKYEPLGAPVYWVHGNNENFDAIASGDLPPDLHYIPNGTAIDVGRVSGSRDGSLRVAALGGTFAPTWYETAASALPHAPKGRSKVRDDKRRHFVHEQVEACKVLREVDVFLTHEAAKPFRPFPGGRGPDAGKGQVNEVLRAVRPRLHLFGHHHRFSEQDCEGVKSVGLDLVRRSCLLIDAGTMEYELRSS